jgi:hypothetical protein
VSEGAKVATRGTGRLDAVGFVGSAAGVGHCGVGERTDRRGPRVNEGGERTR